MTNGTNLRTQKIEVLCTTYEHEQFTRAATARGMTLSAWVRDSLRMQMIRDRTLQIDGAK